MRMAPISAVNPAPTCAARAVAAMSGVTSRTLAKLPTSPVNASAPICSRPLNPWSPTSVPVKKDMAKTTKTMPLPKIHAPEPTAMLLMCSATWLRHRSRSTTSVTTRVMTLASNTRWFPNSANTPRTDLKAPTGYRVTRSDGAEMAAIAVRPSPGRGRSRASSSRSWR